MYWQEDDTDKPEDVPDDIADVLFSIDCKRLPVDHAYDLSAALRQALPWIGQEGSGVAVHTIHVAGSQNGWERPVHGSDQHLILSRRTKLTVRAPKERTVALMDELEGRTLEVSGCRLTIGAGKIRPLSNETTLLSRYVVTLPEDNEDGFLSWVVQELTALGIRVRKALCGRATPLSTPAGPLYTRSLMLANLSPEASIRLQQTGLGPRREMGCGIFIPHKGIGPVKKTS
jgi:CRISPR-associated protein Cas6